ncbi:MAG TPA: fibronectin type III domain-containing protein [Thermomonospora sp.]|nr:fibronectin type III domain-containing protein [Thermomonospora sp.]
MSGERRPGPAGFLRRALGRDRLTGQVALGLVGVLCVAAVVYGVGVAGAKYELSDIGAWLSASRKGTVVHANGLAGKIDGRADLIAGMRGHRIRVVQDGGVVLLVDEVTGVVSRLDPSQLRVSQSRRFAVGVQVVVGPGVAYTVDSVKGTVQRIDPVTLSAVGAPAALTPPLGQAGVDGRGRLWVPTPQTGQAVPIHAGRPEPAVTVGRPGDRLALSIAAGVPVVANSTDATATIIKPEGLQKVALPSTVTRAGRGGVQAPSVTDGQVVPMLGGQGSLVLLDTGTGALRSVALTMARHDFGVPQMLGPRVYIPDETVGALVVYHSSTGSFEARLPVTGKPGPLEVFVKDGMLWVNDPDGENALSVDQKGTLKRIRKYDPQVPGGDKRRPLPTQGPPRGDDRSPPPRPRDDAPGAPRDVRAVGSQGTITVTFRPPARSRVTPTGYALRDAAGRPVPGAIPGELPNAASGLRFTVPNLRCGVDYTYRVTVRYADPRTRRVTDGAFAMTPPTQACEEPGAPTAVQSVGDNGQVRVTFSRSGDTTGVKEYVLVDGHGAPVRNAAPSRIAPDARSLAFTVTGLDCDVEYTYKVVARFTRGGQAASGPTTTRPCKAPASPTGLTAQPMNHEAKLTWQGSGFDVTYTVKGPNGQADVRETTYTATGLTNNKQHTFTVTAHNAAGTARSSATVTADLTYKRHVLRNANNNQTDTLIRPEPKKQGEVGRIPKGQYRDLTMICQTYGDTVTEDETGETSNVWNRIEWNGGTAYLSVTLMTGPRTPGGDVYQCDD